MLNIGIIGCGQNAEDLHFPALKAINNVRIKAICDINAKQLADVGRKFGITNQYIEINEMLKKEELDIIIVNTPGYTHYEICLEIIERGINIIVEKPITLDLDSTLDLQRKSNARGVKICVLHNYRYRTPMLLAKKYLDEGKVGEVTQINVSFHGESLFGLQKWMWNEVKNKVLLYELGIHFIDLFPYFGSRFKKIIGFHEEFNKDLNCHTRVYALLKFEDGIIGILDIQLFTSSNYYHCDIFGTANDVKIKLLPHYCRIYSGNLSPFDEFYLEGKRIYNMSRDILRSKFKINKVNYRVSYHYKAFKMFIDSLLYNKPNALSIEDIIGTMELLEALSEKIYKPH